MKKHSVKIIGLLIGVSLLAVPVSSSAWSLFKDGEKKESHKHADFKELMGVIINSYLTVQQNLAADKTDHLDHEAKKMLKTARALEELIEEGNHSPALHEFHETVDMEKLIHYAEALSSHAAHIKESRHVFKEISKQLVSYVGVFGKPDNVKHDVLYVANCPMYEGGSDWVQLSKEIKNPYYGTGMLTCGTIKSDSTKRAPKESEHHHGDSEKHEHKH